MDIKYCINCDKEVTPELVSAVNADFCSDECAQEFTDSADTDLLANSTNASSALVSPKPQAQNLPDGKTFSALIDGDGNLKK